MNLKICPLTNRPLFLPIEKSTEYNAYKVENKITGIYFISKYALENLQENIEEIPIIIGYLRNHYEENKTPVIIDTELLSKIKNIKYPNTFKTKCDHLLNFIYKKSGSTRELLTFRSILDYSITYSDIIMFNRSISYLLKKGFVNGKVENKNSRGDYYYWDIEITDEGEEFIRKLNPDLVLRDLLSQPLQIGNDKENNMLNEARKLFFGPDSNFETKRSSCEILSKILEPKREILKKIIGKKDVSTFFEIVNNFDIRHNNKSILEIKYEEQLEWIFFSLLNSINLYVKALNRNK